METKNYRRVTLRSSIKIGVAAMAEAPTLSFKLKRSSASSIINGFRRAANLQSSSESDQIRNLRSTKHLGEAPFRKIYSKFRAADRYVTGSVRDYHVTN